MRRVKRMLLGLLVATAIAFFVGEGTMRFLLFSDSEIAIKWGEDLRAPRLFADASNDSDYFKLRHRWTRPERRLQVHALDSSVGWSSAYVQRLKAGNVFDSLVAGRRPILMFGDSFAACMTSEQDCWQGLFGETALASEMALVNFGVRGYGLGQTYLSMKDPLERWGERNPIVVVGILVDDDLDRVLFDFRGAPKPVFGVEEGQLQIDYPGKVGIEEWLDQHPVAIDSYLVTYLRRSRPFLPKSKSGRKRRDAELVSRKKEVSTELLVTIRDDLEGRGLDYFFIIFEGPKLFGARGRKSHPDTWRRKFLYKSLEQLEIPWVSAELVLRDEVAKDQSVSRQDFFIPDGAVGGRHYNRRGNAAVMKAVLSGVNGNYESGSAIKEVLGLK